VATPVAQVVRVADTQVFATQCDHRPVQSRSFGTEIYRLDPHPGRFKPPSVLHRTLPRKYTRKASLVRPSEDPPAPRANQRNGSGQRQKRPCRRRKPEMVIRWHRPWPHRQRWCLTPGSGNQLNQHQARGIEPVRSSKISFATDSSIDRVVVQRWGNQRHTRHRISADGRSGSLTFAPAS